MNDSFENICSKVELPEIENTAFGDRESSSSENARVSVNAVTLASEIQRVEQARGQV